MDDQTYLGDVVDGSRVVRLRDALHTLGGGRAVVLLHVARHVALVDCLAACYAGDPRVFLLLDPLAGRADGARVPVRDVEDVILGVILLFLRYRGRCRCRLRLLLAVFLLEARARPLGALHG